VGPPPDYFMTPPSPDAAAASGAGFAMPTQVPPPAPAWQSPYVPAAAGVGMGVGLMSQFSGVALSSCVLGVVTVLVPLFFGYVFYILPIAGILAGARAIMRGKVIGGSVGIGLNVIGGLITIIALRG
jgi:hypothetical protein